MFSFRLLDRLKFFVERQFVKGAHYQFLAMALVLAFFSLVGGILVLGTEPGEGLAETVWWAFLRLSDPGYLGDDVGFRRRLVSTILTMSGYVLVLGTVVAILTRWLINFMRQLERGLTPVVMKDHILVLGWTDRTLPVLREILLSTAKVKRFLARMGRKRRIRLAVMADDITPEMAHELRTDPAIAERVRDVVLRSGSSLDVRHLQRVASLQASVIIVPTQIFDGQSTISSDVRTIKTLLTLEGLTKQSENPPPYVVAEIQDARKLPVIRRAYTGPMEVIAGDAAISELMVQTIHHPGLSRVYGELLSAGLGNEFVIHPRPELAGRTIEEASRLFDDVLLCGVVRKTNDTFVSHLNPPPSFTLNASDGLVFIALPNARVEPVHEPTPEKAPAVEETSAATRKGSLPPKIPRRKVLILGWSQKVITVLREFSTYRNEAVDITIASTYSPVTREREVERYGIELPGGRCRQVEADYTVRRELSTLKPDEYDNIIMMISDRVADGEESDARTIVGYLCLQEVLMDADNGPHILVELADSNNKKLLESGSDEVIVSPLLVSHILAQVAMHRGLLSVLEELFTAGGAELTFCSPSEYQIPCERLTFRQLQELVRRSGDTLIGVNDEINPDSHKMWTVDESFRFIALTTMKNGSPETQPPVGEEDVRSL